MASFKNHSAFYSIIAVLGLAALAGGWGIYDRATAAKKNTTLLSQKRSEMNMLLGSNPAPTEESKAAVEADLKRTQAALADMREQLKGRGDAAQTLRSAPVPAESTDLYFNIANFVEKTREKAQAAGIKVKADERFGFSAYANSGPDRELIPQVFRQRQVAEYLLDSLIEARPVELISVQRERPLTNTERQASRTGQSAPAPRTSGGGQGPSDLFEIDPRITARVAGFVNATAFRLTFTGETEALRSLLNKLGTFELPLVVRGVEVEPVAKQQTTSAATAPANALSAIFGTPVAPTPAQAEKPKPLVEKNLSKFTVTVELIDLVEAPAPEANPTN